MKPLCRRPIRSLWPVEHLRRCFEASVRPVRVPAFGSNRSRKHIQFIMHKIQPFYFVRLPFPPPQKKCLARAISVPQHFSITAAATRLIAQCRSCAKIKTSTREHTIASILVYHRCQNKEPALDKLFFMFRRHCRNVYCFAKRHE